MNNLNNLNNLIGFIASVNRIGRRKIVYENRPYYYEILTDDEYTHSLRLSKNCVNYLLRLLARKLETVTDE